MNSTHSEAEVTQSGQAIRINNSTASTLSSLFSTNIGPYGTYKALISPGQSLRITKDGNTLCKEIQFSHPTAVIITRAAVSLYNTYGDGASSLITLCCDIFNTAFRFYNDGTPIPKICSSLQTCLNDITAYMGTLAKPLDDETLKSMAYNLCNTKADKKMAGILSNILIEAIKNVSQTSHFDISMVEVIKMQEGDPLDTTFVNGLVLDHSGRHLNMPEYLENVAILITNMSLEYEKPEINAEFCYSSAKQREELATQEREFILQKARAIAEFGKTIKDTKNMNLMVVSEKGIDPFSLEIFAEAGILALRRAKRRNLERLVKMCGGSIITQVSQLNPDCLGYCQKVEVKKVGEDKFTFVEGTPLKGSCTVLIRGNSQYEMERMVASIKGALKSLQQAIRDKVYIEGGYSLYKSLALHLKRRMDAIPEKDVVGYKILEVSFTNMIKILLRNSGMDVEENLVKVLRDDCEKVIDNFSVSSAVISNSIVVSMTLLLVDEIIKAGKPIKEEKIEK